MYRTLIVPLDGSEVAERVLPYAVRLALANRGRLVLVRAVSAPLPPTPDGFGWEQLVQEAMIEAESYLAETAARLATRVPVETVVTRGGTVADEIVEAVADCQADGIVMATHGRTGVSHLVHGSVAEAVLANSPVPVFLVHARAGQAVEAPFDPVAARLLVPLDGSPFATTAIQTAVEMLGIAGELVLVGVLQPPERVLRDVDGNVVAFIDQQQHSQTVETRASLELLARRLRRDYPGIHVSTEVRTGQAAAGIVAAAIERHVDLVVMATHGRTGLTRAILGSVAGDVLRTGSTPVLLVHPQQPPAASPEPVTAAPTGWVLA